jgi:hypothetical protein
VKKKAEYRTFKRKKEVRMKYRLKDNIKNPAVGMDVCVVSVVFSCR